MIATAFAYVSKDDEHNKIKVEGMKRTWKNSVIFMNTEANFPVRQEGRGLFWVINKQ